MPKYRISSGLPSYPAGLSDKDAALVLPLYRAINSLATQLAVQTGNVEYAQDELAKSDQFSGLTNTRGQILTIKAAEPLYFGALLTLSLSGGKVVANLADATTATKPAHAVLNTPGGLATGAFGTAIFLEGRSQAIAGTAFMHVYYLATAGQIQAAAPTASGALVQRVGYGLGSAGFYFKPSFPA